MAIATTACAAQFRMGFPLTTSDTYISYLPSAHSFEAMIFAVAIIYGTRCGYFGGNVLKMASEDLPVLQPTVFPSVPRLFNKIYGGIKDALDKKKGCAGLIAKKAISTKLAKLAATGDCTHGCFDALLFAKKIKPKLGGATKIMITGSAPIAGDVLNFLKICFVCPIIEGYGMTESCAGSTTTLPNDPEAGHVGGPLANVKIRLRDIPEMGYLHTNNPPKGEICFWGPAVMQGYFKCPEKTAEAVINGWMHSGDVGLLR